MFAINVAELGEYFFDQNKSRYFLYFAYNYYQIAILAETFCPETWVAILSK